MHINQIIYSREIHNTHTVLLYNSLLLYNNVSSIGGHLNLNFILFCNTIF